ncbi:MAG: DUF262 domain-containing protein [Firmicutes bacterium]|nr:DUF262 domain-containing protein [Bacillota bacterium]
MKNTENFVELLSKFKVEIPIMQRDYAQGRQGKKIRRVRENFLTALFGALKEAGQPLKLDFIYGAKQERKDDKPLFIPLDGQQRLTTLFLLHWYGAVKEGCLEEVRDLLSNFTYETRHSSRVFCQEIIKFQPGSLEGSLREVIQDQPWFFSSWQHDPTIQSMLVMIDAIQAKDGEEMVDSLWKSLTEDDKISFYLLPMDQLSKPDDLYIKMNSRGKELTEFEYFKSRFSEFLAGSLKEEFDGKVDQVWSDLFWFCFRDSETEDPALRADQGFLRFYSYLTDILSQSDSALEITGGSYPPIISRSVQAATQNDLSEPNLEVYSSSENVRFLFDCLDLLHQDNFSREETIFSQVFYLEEDDFAPNKCRLFFANPQIDLFRKCAESYDNSARVNPFSVGEQLLLYACLLQLHKGGEADETFRANIRMLRNLIAHSEDRMRREELPALLHDVSVLMETGELPEGTRLNNDLIREERMKGEFISARPDLKEVMHRAEDHRLLRGTLGFFPFDDKFTEKVDTFRRIFTPQVDFLEISRALMCLGDFYKQGESRIIIGHEREDRWRDLFARSGRSRRFSAAKEVIDAFLSLMPELGYNPGLIIEEYLASYEAAPYKAKDFNYYYVRYAGFRNNLGGYYYWTDPDRKYEARMFRATTTGGNSWSPFLYSLKESFSGDDRVSLGSYFHPLVIVVHDEALELRNFDEGFLVSPQREGFSAVFSRLVEDGVVDKDGWLRIAQNEAGYDLEDRVEVGLRFLLLIGDLNW